MWGKQFNMFYKNQYKIKRNTRDPVNLHYVCDKTQLQIKLDKLSF